MSRPQQVNALNVAELYMLKLQYIHARKLYLAARREMRHQLKNGYGLPDDCGCYTLTVSASGQPRVTISKIV